METAELLKQVNLRPYQIQPVNDTIKSLLNKKKTALIGCPGSGKTEMAIDIMTKLFNSSDVKRVLILPHSTTVLKDNFTQRLEGYNLPFIDKVVIHLPQSKHKITGKFDLVIVDEAHENYLADVVQKIVKDIPMQLLLTGTPSKLILKGGFELIVIAMEDVPSENFAKVGIELVASKYNWSDDDYTKDSSLKSTAKIGKLDTRDAVDKVIECIINRLRNINLSATEINNGGFIPSIKMVVNDILDNKIGKTMFVCNRITQADWVNEKLIEIGYNSTISHSGSDKDSDEFDRFKRGEFDTMVVVNRGRLGYSDDNLYNIIDMSGTRNPDIIYQMFARCVRGNQSQQKMFIKLSPNGPGMMDLTNVSMCMALSLMFKSTITNFNGKNFKGMFIPIIKESRESKSGSKKGKKKVSARVYFPEYTNDVLVQLKDIKHNLSDDTSIYKEGMISEIISNITGCRTHIDSALWTKEKCKEMSSLCKNSTEFCVDYNGAFLVSKSNGWISEFFPKKRIMKPLGFWNIENSLQCLIEFKGTRREFAIKYRSAFDCLSKQSPEVLDNHLPKIIRMTPGERTTKRRKTAKDYYENNKDKINKSSILNRKIRNKKPTK